MKKILLSAIAAIMTIGASAINMSLQAPRAELPNILASESMLADGDTFLPGTAICRRMPAGDQQGLYYMVLSLLNSEQNVFPQAQVHMLLEDTLSIDSESTKFPGAFFYQTESAGGQATGLSGNLSFLEYVVDGDNTYAKYDIVFTLSFANHAPMEVKYRGYVTFIDAQGKIYIPTHEPTPSAIGSTAISAPITKSLCNGQLIIEYNDHCYNAQGTLVK